MAKVYLDTNYFIDIIKRDKNKYTPLSGHLVYVSPLSFHISFYALKLKTPNFSILKIIDELVVIDLNKAILSRALQGPTNDLEDNLQLQSAVESNCDIFLTRDKELLKMGYFGKTKISSNL